MDAPRHRFRREDIEGEASQEGLSPVDIKLVSMEDELRTISSSSAMQARDSLALRARVEELEKHAGGDVKDTLSKVFDHIETQDDRVEQVFDRLQVLERRLHEVGQRLDNLGEIGRIENLPGLLEQSLVTNLDDLEARFESRMATLEVAGGGASEEETQALRQEIEQKNRDLRLQIEKLFEKRQDETVELIENAVRNLKSEEYREGVEKEVGLIRTAVVELQEAIEYAVTQEDLETLKSVTESGVSEVEVQELKNQVGSLVEELSGVTEQLSTVKNLFDGGDDWAARLEESLGSMQQSAQVLEGHQERVDLALRLVKQLEEKSQTLNSGTVAAGGGGGGLLSPPAGESQLKLTLRDLIREMVKNRVSDLHIKTGRAITARIGRELIQFSTPPLTPADSFQLIVSALRPNLVQRLVEERDIEFVHQYESIRLRANVFFDRGNLSATFKMLSNRPPELENLGLPKALMTGLLTRPSGLILVCGLPGSGRTTTLTASLDYLNRTRQLHLVSLEDRLDFTHEDRRSLVTQREIGSDIITFAQGMTRAVGQDCDVLFVADLASKETMEATFAAVESGLLVVGAITAQSTEDAIPRLINLFPESERKMRARIFAGALQGILSLRLFERADGEGQIPASELLLANATVKRLIEDANLSALRAQIIQGAGEGMQTFAESIERLMETGLIAPEVGARELERLGAVATPRVGAGPATSHPPGQPQRPEGSSSSPPASPAPAPASGESTPAASATPATSTEAFGEEDTLMNWL